MGRTAYFRSVLQLSYLAKDGCRRDGSGECAAHINLPSETAAFSETRT